MKSINIVFVLLILLGLIFPVQATDHYGQRITHLEILPVDVSNMNALAQNYPGLHEYFGYYSQNNGTDPYAFSYFAVNTTVEIWNGDPYDALVFERDIAVPFHFFAFPENTSLSFERSQKFFPFIEDTFKHGDLVHVPPGLSSYYSDPVYFIRVNQSGLTSFPKGMFVFMGDGNYRLNATVKVTDTGMTIEYAERPSDWKPGLMHNLPIRFTPESWATFVMSMQVSGVIVVGLITYAVLKRRQRKLEST